MAVRKSAKARPAARVVRRRKAPRARSDLAAQLVQAQAQQKATTAILKAIARSPADAQPAFDAIVRACHVLFRGSGVFLRLAADGHLHLRAHIGGVTPNALPIDSKGPMGASFLAKRTLHFSDLREAAGKYPRLRELALKHGFRSGIYAPLLRGGTAIGGLSVLRRELGAFNKREVEVFNIFAAQAVIAIENARLFNETRKALARQTATADMLRVISRSPTDVQPVFDAIVVTAIRLLNCDLAFVLRRDGTTYSPAAAANTHGLLTDRGPSGLPVDPAHNFPSRAMLSGRLLHLPDWTGIELPEHERRIRDAFGVRCALYLPLMREGDCVGLLALAVGRANAFSAADIALAESFRDQALIAVENARLFNETREALERQTATAEILKVIASSPSDVQPVFDAIVRSGVRLFGTAVVLRLARDGRMDRVAELQPGQTRIRRGESTALDEGSFSGRAILRREIVHMPDIEAEEWISAETRKLQREAGYRSAVFAPMLRDGEAVGAIGLMRGALGAFDDGEIALLQTFADQAVIAIENARLFNETREALERQTATSNVLREISRSTFDLDAILQTLLDNAMRLCGAVNCAMFLKGADGSFRFASQVGYYVPGSQVETALRENPIWPGVDTTTGRALLERRTVHTHDILSDPGYRPDLVALAEYRTNLAVPMLRDGEVIGAITLTRGKEVNPFTDKQIELVEGFSAQAVIAIENVRLFNETKEALERQTATAEILKVISRSPSDTQPVFETIVRNAQDLCGGLFANVFDFDGERLQFLASSTTSAEMRDLLQRQYPMRPDRSQMTGRVIQAQGVVRLDDALADPEYNQRHAVAGGWRRMIGVPMLRDGQVIGVIVVGWPDPGPISSRHEELLKTFADQAVIAIENVRLFNETKEALERQTATAEILKVIASSPSDVQPVFDAIVRAGVQLFENAAVAVARPEDGEMRLKAIDETDKDRAANWSIAFPFPLSRDYMHAAAVLDCRMVEVADAAAEQEDFVVGRRNFLRTGYRAMTVVPMVRDGVAIGTISVVRAAPGALTERQKLMLQTFADQAVIAIENVRLFNELKEKSHQLEVASQHKSQFLASMSHELRTPLNAILGFNEMILGEVYGPVPADMREPVEDIQKSGRHLLGLINNVLDLAKIEAGRMELALSDYSVHDVVENVRATLRPLAEQKGLELEVSLPADLPLAHGDAGRLRQCLMNLAGNSLKFTKRGKVALAVSMRDAGTLLFTVSDTGIGIPEDKIGNLFTEFKQTDATIASEYGGTGLGLSITKKFVEMHGGRIWVESEVGKGTTFLFEIPLRAAA